MTNFQSQNPSSPRLVTVCIKGQPAKTQQNTDRLQLLTNLAGEVNSRWEKLDAVVFPGGFLHLNECLGSLCYTNRVKVINSTGVVTLIKKGIRKLTRSPGAVIVLGIDGPDYDNGDGGDQLCVAVNKEGIVGIGRKIFPLEGDEAEGLLCFDADFSDQRRVVTLQSGHKAVLAACYDMFGVAEMGDIKGKRARSIQWLGDEREPLARHSSEIFAERLAGNLAAFEKLLNGVTVAIGAIHFFGSTAFWQRHGMATCSAALGKGYAVGAAHFGVLPQWPSVSTLAAAGVPISHLKKGLRRRANSWGPSDYFISKDGSALARLYC